MSYSFKLLQAKVCFCGETHIHLPEKFVIADALQAVFWDCKCGVAIFTDIENVDTTEDPFNRFDWHAASRY